MRLEVIWACMAAFLDMEVAPPMPSIAEWASPDLFVLAAEGQEYVRGNDVPVRQWHGGWSENLDLILIAEHVEGDYRMEVIRYEMYRALRSRQGCDMHCQATPKMDRELERAQKHHCGSAS